MIRHIFHLKHLFVLLSCFIALSSYGKNDKENILVINSYIDNYIWSNYVYDAILNNYIGREGKIQLDMESMNMLLVDDVHKMEERVNLVYEKYANHTPKIIIVMGNPAFVAFKDIFQNKWKDIPVVWCTDNDRVGTLEDCVDRLNFNSESERSVEELARGMNVAIVHCPIYLKETISMIKQLQPNMKKLAFISDGRYVNEQIRRKLQNIMEQEFPDIELIFLTDGVITLDKMLDSVRSYNDSVGILFSSWIRKKEYLGEHYLSANNYKIIASVTSQPLFVLTDIGIHSGEMAGGYLYCGLDMGKTVVNILRELNNNNYKASAIPPTNAGKPQKYLCYNVLEAAGISSSIYPKNAIYYFAPASFWEKYRYVLIGFTFLILILIVMLLSIYVMRKDKKLKEKELLLLSKYKTSMDNMPIAFFKSRLLFDEQGKVVDYVLEEANTLYLKSLPDQKHPIGLKGSEMDADYIKYIPIYQEVWKCQKPYSFEHYYPVNRCYYETKVMPAAEKDQLDIFVIDITKLRKTQALVESINHKLSMALDVANVIPWKWDLKNKTILCDVKRPIELQREGKNEDEDSLSVPEAEYFAKIHKEDRKRVEQAYAALIQGKTPKVREEYRVVNHAENHTKFEWVEAQATIDQYDESGQPSTLVGSSVIITKRKLMELDLREAKERAEESNRLKSAFLANMSHEIRTPLNAIVGFSNILSNTEEIEEKQEYVNIIENNNTLLLQLINDILDLSKIEAGTLEFVYTDFNLNEMMRELERIFRLRIEGKPVEVCCETTLPFCHIHSEKNRLMQVLMNMLTNAVKFTEEGKISLGYRLQEDHTLYFYVSDTGCGIPKEKKETVFGRFVKLDSFQQGTGLGLSICESIVHKLGGRIGVDSDAGQGSTFWFTIPYTPVQIAPEKYVEDNLTPSEKEIVNRDKLKILVAEDINSNYKLFESILKNDYQLIHAANGQEAVELFKEHNPHLILMDINMPVLNGYEAVSEIRKISLTVPIIAVTAYAYESDEQRILHSGFNAYTSKPINANTLKNKITLLLEKRLILI